MTKRYSNSWHAWPEKNLDEKEKEKVSEVKEEISFNPKSDTVEIPCKPITFMPYASPK